jgi:hypothetical protein
LAVSAKSGFASGEAAVPALAEFLEKVARDVAFAFDSSLST